MGLDRFARQAGGLESRGGTFTVRPGAGNIQTRRQFTDYQNHLEWRVPASSTGSGQARGNGKPMMSSGLRHVFPPTAYSNRPPTPPRCTMAY